MGKTTRVALLIDAENASARYVERVLEEIARYGVAHVRHAYGNWKSPALQSWEARLHDLAIRPVQQFSYTAGKNASDMAMVIDAMDLLHSGHVDGFALMSSDGDFTPLVMRLRASGKSVHGFGERDKTAAPFISACSRFTHVEDLAPPTSPVSAGTGQRWPGERLRSEVRLVKALQAAVGAARAGDGWSELATVGSHLRQHGKVDPSAYGYAKLVDMVQAVALFDVRRGKHGYQVRARTS